MNNNAPHTSFPQGQFVSGLSCTLPAALVISFVLALTLGFALAMPFQARAAEDAKAWQERMNAQFAAQSRASVTDTGPDLHTMIGSMIMVGFRGAELKEDDPFFEILSDGFAGHVILFDRDMTSGGGPRNIISAEQVKKLTADLRAAAPMPMFIAVDQEGGRVARLKPEIDVSELPAAKTLGRSTPENTGVLTRRLGRDIAALGINVNFAPVVDLDTYQDNPVIGKLGRSFGADPAQVSRHAQAFSKSMIDAGVIPTLKHFPGHGSSRVDSHLTLPDITEHWDAKTELQPYVDAIGAGWPGMIMVGHLRHRGLDPVHPTSLSGLVINGFLRDVLGWQGVVVTDDLQMKAITGNYTLEHTVLLAILGGADLLVFGNNLEYDPELGYKVYHAIAQHVEAGRISRERIHQSWQRITSLQSVYTNKAMARTNSRRR